MPPTPPTPTPGSITDPFWDGARQGKLVIQRCQACGTYIHLPRPVCRNCLSFDLAGEQVGGRATLYSFTETHRPFHPFFVDRVPYLLGVVELAEQRGLRLLSNLVQVSEPEVRIGMELQVRFDRLSANLAIPVFAPAGSEAR